MTITINLNADDPKGPIVTDRHFGLNFVADYEGIGAKPWQKFDEIALNLGITQLRYPGGVSAEKVFDYRNPNKLQTTLENGEKVKLTPLSDFIHFCNLTGTNPTIIIPVSMLLTNTNTNSHRSFDATQSEDLRQFITLVLSQVNSDVKLSFELGNEYEGYMSSTEYGRVATALVKLIDDATNQYRLEVGSIATVLDPEVLVQSWGYSAGGALTPMEIAARNDQVIAEFDHQSLARIDGVVSHYYYRDGRNSGNAYEQSLGRIDSQVAGIAALHDAWETASGRELISRTSEWNVQKSTNTELGLKQIQPMMEMFSSFLRNGFDALDFWSAQYHATSAADASGRLMAAGTMLDVLKPNIVGTKLGDVTSTNDLSVYTFINNSKQVSVVTSKVANSMSVDLALSEVPLGFKLVNGFIVGVNELTADGKYKELSGLPAYGEPDARVTLFQVPMSIVSGSRDEIALDSFETLILIFTKEDATLPTVYGTDSSDWLYGTGTRAQYIGGAGWDTVIYNSSPVGVNVQMEINAPSDDFTEDVFVSIEAIIGSSFSDRIVGTRESDNISGLGGDDQLFGGAGGDWLLGGGGNDTISGGAGNDEIYGEEGDDFIYADGGNDAIYGGSGVDTISLGEMRRGVSVWSELGMIETREGTVKFSSIERFVGTDFGDRFVLVGTELEVDGGKGDDSFHISGPGRHIIFGGEGKDYAEVHTAQVDFFGGSGDDAIFSSAARGSFFGGDGDDRATVGGNLWTFEGGEGDDVFVVSGLQNTFVFSGEIGHDSVVGFSLGVDHIIFKDGACNNASIAWNDNSTLFTFSEDSSVLFLGVVIPNLDEVYWDFV